MTDNTEINNLKKKVSELERENAILNNKLIHFQELYNNTTIGLYRTNIDGQILNANPPLVKMLGFSSLEDLQSYNLNKEKLISSEERKKFIDTMTKKGIVIGREAIWLRKNGEKIYIRESAKAIKDQNGEIIFFEGTVEDIDAQKTTERELLDFEIMYKRLVDTLPNGIVIHKERNIIFANDYAINAIGAVKKNSLINKNIFDYIHPDYHERTISRLTKVIKDFKQSTLSELALISHQGNILYTEALTIPYNQDDQLYLLTVFTDITERKITEKELRLSEITYRGMLNSISEAVFIHDEEGKFLDVNKAAMTLFGYPSSYFQGKTPRNLDASGKNDFDKIFRKIRAAFEGKRQILEFWAKSKNGKEFQTEVTLTNGIYFDKKVVIAVLRDITERKKVETALKQSEKRYRHLINFAVGGILIGDMNGYIIEANAYIYKLFGRKRNEIIGKHITDGFFTKESLENNPLNFEKLKKGKILINQRMIQRPDGSTLPIEMHSKQLPDGTFQSIYHDISNRLKIEHDILEAKAKAESLNLHKHALLSALPDMLFTFNDKGLVIDFYSNSHEHLVSNPKLFLNKDLKHFIPKDISEKTIVHIKNVLESKKTKNFQYQLDIGGKKEYFDSKMVYFKENTVLCVIRNITERMELISDLRNAQHKAEESDRLKSAFLSNLSHEIRTPMNGILGFTELLKDDISKSEKLEYLEIIESSCNQLLLILDDIIEIAKIEAGLMKKKTDSIEVNSFIKNIHHELSGIFSRNHDVKFILSDNLPTNEINSITDPIKLKQVLTNFVTNAYKFTEKGFVELGYQVISDTYIMFYVKDTGIGISKENQDKIFNRFIQVDNQLGGLSRGSGLGLSICKAYADILNGDIIIDSEIGKGSTFYLKVPIISLG